MCEKKRTLYLRWMVLLRKTKFRLGGRYKMDNDYISRESFRKNIADILNDETCPLHIAATIEQYLDEEPSVDIKWKDDIAEKE